jgi:hypothetical protein
MRKRFLVGSAIVLALTLGVGAAVQAAGGSSKNFQNAALGSRATGLSDETNEKCFVTKYDTLYAAQINKPATSATIVTFSAETTIDSPTLPFVRIDLDGKAMPPLDQFTSSDGFRWSPFGEIGSVTTSQNNAAGTHVVRVRVRRGCVFHSTLTVIY